MVRIPNFVMTLLPIKLWICILRIMLSHLFQYIKRKIYYVDSRIECHPPPQRYWISLFAIIISSPCCLVSTSTDLHPQGTKSADGERLDIVATGLYVCTGKLREHLWILGIECLHRSPKCPLQHGNSSWLTPTGEWGWKENQLWLLSYKHRAGFFCAPSYRDVNRFHKRYAGLITVESIDTVMSLATFELELHVSRKSNHINHDRLSNLVKFYFPRIDLKIH